MEKSVKPPIIKDMHNLKISCTAITDPVSNSFLDDSILARCMRTPCMDHDTIYAENNPALNQLSSPKKDVIFFEMFFLKCEKKWLYICHLILFLGGSRSATFWMPSYYF